jgi:hypothetical protein
MDDLIADKIAPHDWSAHSGGSSSIFVNASTWALMLTGRVLDEGEGGIEGTLRAMVRRLGEPVIRKAVAAAMREMGEQFVLGRTIAEAVKRGRPKPTRCVITAPMRTRSRRSIPGRTAPTSATITAFRSSSRRCIRATRWRSARRCCR